MTFSVHFIVEPVTNINLSVSPFISSLAWNFVQFEASFVYRCISKGKFTLAVFFAFEVIASVYGSVRPAFFAKTVLLVVSPFAYVPGAVCMDVSSFPIRFVLNPFSFVDVTVRVNKFSLTVCFIWGPLSFVPWTILPNLFALSMSLFTKPLACVNCPWLQDNVLPILKLVAVSWVQSLFLERRLGVSLSGVLLRLNCCLYSSAVNTLNWIFWAIGK